MRQHLEFQLTRPSGYEPPFRLTRYVGLVLARYPHTHSLYTETLLLVPERRQQPADAPEGVAVRNEGPKASSCQTATGTESSNIFTQGLKCRSLRGSIIPASARVEVQHGLNPTGTGCQESCDTGPAQSYIDEKPNWPDGTPVALTPMTTMQWRIWSLAAAGKFFEGLVVFMTGVALPLIAKEFNISSLQHGLVSAASLTGILVGAIGLGGLSDHFGRRTMFIFEMFVFIVFLGLLISSPNFAWLVVCLFGLGLALGCDYPTAHLMISESIPSSVRGRLVLAAFGFQALGALSGALLGYVVLKNFPELRAWRWMYATAIIPAALVLFWRFGITESASWLLHRGRA